MQKIPEVFIHFDIDIPLRIFLALLVLSIGFKPEGSLNELILYVLKNFVHIFVPFWGDIVTSLTILLY